MPQSVVDQFEVIEVEIDHSDAAAMALCLGDCVDHAIAEQQPVRQAGQRVVVGLILELFLRRLALSDVAIVDDDRVDAAVVQQVLAEGLQPDPRAVLVEKAELRVRFPIGRRRELAEDFPRCLAVARMNESQETRIQQLALAVAEKALRRRSDVGEGQIGIEEGDATPAFLDQSTEALLALLELVVRPFPLRDIANEGAVCQIVARSHRIDHHLDGELLAVRATSHAFNASLRDSAGNRLEERRDDVAWKRPPHDIPRSQAERRLRLRIPLDDVRLTIDADHRIQRRVDQLLEARFRAVQRLLRPRALHGLAHEVGYRLEKADLEFLEFSRRAGVGQDDTECAAGGGDDHAGP